MTGAYKLIFDLCLYYSLSGFYTTALYQTPPSPFGFVLLCLAVILERIAGQHGKQSSPLRLVLMALPAAALIPGLDTPAVIQLIPGWAYLLYCVFTGRTSVAYDRFQEQFRLALLLLAAVLPGFVISDNALSSLETVTPYIALMLISGVFLLRILRKNAPDDLRQLLPLAAVVAVGLLLTAAQIPQLLGAALSWLYRNGIIKFLEGIIFLFCQLLYVLYIVLNWVLSLFGRELNNPFQQQQQQQTTQEESQQQVLFPDQTDGNVWIQRLFSVAVAVLLILAVFKLFRHLRGARISASKKAAYTEQRQRVSANSRPGRVLLRPRDPRLAVRFYYAKFLQECQRRGMSLKPGCTSEELASLSAEYFPGTDPADLRELYVAARYRETGTVSPAQADRAALCWRSLKKAKLPEYKK